MTVEASEKWVTISWLEKLPGGIIDFVIYANYVDNYPYSVVT